MAECSWSFQQFCLVPVFFCKVHSQAVWSNRNMCKYLLSDTGRIKVLYLYPIHAGLHLQLLHSFPGLGDAGRAVVGNTVLHGAPVTQAQGGGNMESMSITLNPQSSVLLPPGVVSNVNPPSPEQPFSTTTFLLKDPFCLGECVLQQPCSILSEERAQKAAAGQQVVLFQPVLMHDYLFIFLSFYLSGFFCPQWAEGKVTKGGEN